MDYAKKPTVFILGKKKTDAPSSKVMSQKKLEQYAKELQKYLDERK